MAENIEVPKMGESVSSGIIAAWLVEDGAAVSEGDELFELETDKATLSVPSTASGVVSRKAEEGDEVEVGQVVATVDTEAAADTDAAAPEAGATAPKTGGEAEATSETGSKAEGGDEAGEEKGTAGGPGAKGSVIPEGVDVSPAVRRIAEEHDLDLTGVAGTGRGGRITKEDALSALEKKIEAAAKASHGVEAARKSADKTGAGADGTDAARGSAAQSGRSVTRPPAFEERQTRKPMSSLRKRIAENLVQSQQTSALLTTFNEIDMSEVVSIRKAYRDEFEKKYDVRLGFMSFFVKACCSALFEFPEANGAIDGDEIVYNNYCNIGVAVSTERGLVVPVIKNAEHKSFAEIEQEIISFATRAKEKKITVDELTGGTFTITNGGVFGSLLSTPIPTPGQSAILGMHTIQKRPVAVGDEVGIHPMMYVALSYDHRIMDGRDAVSFLVRLKQLIEDPHQMLLGL